MAKVYDAQGEADKAARRLCREAFAHGGTVPYSLSRLVDLKLSVKVIRAVYRPLGWGAEAVHDVRTGSHG